jgi:hypothetical protein
MTCQQDHQRDGEGQMHQQPGVQPELQPLLHGQLVPSPTKQLNLVDGRTDSGWGLLSQGVKILRGLGTRA